MKHSLAYALVTLTLTIYAAEQIARDHAKGYTIEHRLAVVPNK